MGSLEFGKLDAVSVLPIIMGLVRPQRSRISLELKFSFGLMK